MFITVTDTTLLTPSGGIASNVPIKIICTQGFDQVLTGSVSEFTTESDGSYDFPLYYGTHAIYVRFDVKLVFIGKVTITDELADTATMSDLLLYTEPMLPSEIALVSSLVEEAREARAETVAAAARAELAAEAASISGGVFSDTTSGISGTSDGDYFSVLSPSVNGYTDLYLNDNGTALYQKTYPSSIKVEKAKETANLAYSTSRVRNIPRSKENVDLNFSTSFGETLGSFGSLRKLPRAEGVDGTSFVIAGKETILVDNVASETDLTEIEASIDNLETSVFEIENPGFAYPVNTQENSSLLYSEDVSGESQIFKLDGSTSVQLSESGFNWSNQTINNASLVKAIRDDGVDKKVVTLSDSGFSLENDNVVYEKLITGQSLALGSRGFVLTDGTTGEEIEDGRYGVLFTPELPDSIGDYCISLEGGPVPSSPAGSTTFEPIHEVVRNSILGESIASSWAVGMRLWDSANGGIDARYLASIAAFGGVPYEDLKKGSTVYEIALKHVQNVSDICLTTGEQHFVGSVSILHGESQTDTTQAEYKAILEEWISDYQIDIVAITGQDVPPIMLTSQMNTGEGGTNPRIPMAQLEAHNDNDDIVLIGPKYQFPYFDQYHMLAEGYVKIAEIEAKAESFYLQGKKWQPLKPVEFTVVDNVLTIKLNNDVAGNASTPSSIGDLVIDIDNVEYIDDYGFTIDSGVIESVAISSNKSEVVITLQDNLAGGEIINYACPVSGFAQPSNGRRGNIRDSDKRTVSRFDGSYLYNYLVAFEQTITL